MPTYCFEKPSGEIIEIVFPFGNAPTRVRDGEDGVIAVRCLRKEIAGQVVSVKGTDTPVRGRKGWPMKPCYASGVHANQANELREHLRKSGVPTDVTKNGDPIYTSAAHRKKALKVRGMNDRNAFS